MDAQRIEHELARIELARGVRIIYACEAGSRAWGFPSPDSDWDVRFIYVHPAEWYMTFDVEHRRDVIEAEDQVLDLSGWDLRKALYLFTRSNGALLEWLESPTIYREVGTLATRLRLLSGSSVNLTALCYHYSHMARRNAREYIRADQVRLKKYLYVIRPLLAIQYIEKFAAVPPVEFDKLLLATVEPTGEGLSAGIAHLLRLKKETPELGTGAPIPVLNTFIDAELARHNDAFKGQGRPTLDGMTLRLELNLLFKQAVGL